MRVGCRRTCFLIRSWLRTALELRPPTNGTWNDGPRFCGYSKREVYGRAPEQKPELRFQVDSENRTALGGKAVRKEITIQVSTQRGKLPLQLLLYAPKIDHPAPVFLGLNFLAISRFIPIRALH